MTAGRRGDSLLLEIRDNGCGMTEEELERAMNGDSNRIGLSNAVRRLQLIYGEKGSLKTETAVGKGTRIEVTIPCRKQESKKNPPS